MQIDNKAEAQSALERFRKNKDHYFATGPNSPLTVQQRQTFHGLSYFPEDPTRRQDVQVEPVDGPETITLQVSSGGVQSYRRFGKVKVTIGDVVAELTIFANEHGLFLPFADALAGSETTTQIDFVDCVGAACSHTSLVNHNCAVTEPHNWLYDLSLLRRSDRASPKSGTQPSQPNS